MQRFGSWVFFRPLMRGGGGGEDTYSVGSLRKSLCFLVFRIPYGEQSPETQ
jgi:hypothetical protein